VRGLGALSAWAAVTGSAASGPNPRRGVGREKQQTVAEVLIADDDADLRATLRTLLEDEGHRVSEASTGQTTLAALRDAPVGYIALLNLAMPDLDGVEVLRTAQRDAALARRHVYVVLSANTGALWNSAQLLIASLDGFMVRKPFDIDEFTSVIGEAAQRLSAH
jgi:CheY-like chemotaxis protein